MKDIFLLSAYTAKFHVPTMLVPLIMALGVAITFIFGTEVLAYIFVGTLALDFITGIMKSRKLGIPITSSRMRDMFFKWMAYLVVLLIGAVLTTYLGMIGLHGAALMWVIGSELVSILENCEVIIGHKIPFLGRIRAFLDAIKGKYR